MTKNGLLSPKEALELLGLYNPETDKKAYTCHLTNLNKRGFLKPVRLGYRSLMWKKKEIDALNVRVEKEGIKLKQKPAKKEEPC
jgi:predicted DNA-binding transcriptional regulator AlpA